MPKYTKWVLFFMAVFLLFVAINIQTGWLFVLDFTLLSFLFTAWVFPKIMTYGEIRGEIYAQPVFEEENLDIMARFKNLSFLNKYFLFIEFEFFKISLFLPSLPKKKTVELSCKVKAAKRGVYSSPELTLKAVGPAGLFEHKKKLYCKGRIVVYPSLNPFPLPAQSSSPVPLLSDKGVFSGKGDGEEFAGIRDYAPGDSLRSVHWPSSAKTGKLMIRETMKIHPFLYTLYLDQNQRRTGDSFEISVKQAAYAIHEISKMGNWVQIFQKGKTELKSLQGNLELLAGIQADQAFPLNEQIKLYLPFIQVKKDLVFFTDVPERFVSESWVFIEELLEMEIRIMVVFSGENRTEASRLLSSWLQLKGVFAAFGA